jgi:hypothetical protein
MAAAKQGRRFSRIPVIAVALVLLITVALILRTSPATTAATTTAAADSTVSVPATEPAAPTAGQAVKADSAVSALATEPAAPTAGQAVKAPLRAEGNIVFEGQSPDGPMAFCMGTYLPTGHEVGGRGVWQQEGEGSDLYVYYTLVGGAKAPVGGIGTWIVSDGDNMRAGTPSGGWCAVSDALTPDAVAARAWQVWDPQKSKWAQAPAAVRVRLLPEVARQEQRAAAVAAARAVGAVVLAGQPAGAPHADCMGVYTPHAEAVVGGRGVWRQQTRGGGGGSSYFLFYAGAIGEWFVGGEASMRAGQAAGKWSVKSDAPTPDLIGDTLFQVAEGTTWVDASPAVRLTATAATERDL